MLSLQEAMQLDFTCGLTDMDVAFGLAFGFDAFGSDSSHNTMSQTCTPPVDVAQVGEGERRRRRRKISNRESARRSRARKQQRMEELERAVEALRAERRALEARLDATARRALAVRRDNARLHAEARALRRRLGEAQRNAVALVGLSQLRASGVPPQPVGGVPSLLT